MPKRRANGELENAKMADGKGGIPPATIQKPVSGLSKNLEFLLRIKFFFVYSGAVSEHFT